MFNQVTTNYTGGDALIEIIIMLSVAFILGFLTKHLWHKFHSSTKKYEKFRMKNISEKKEVDSVLEIKKEILETETIPEIKKEIIKKPIKTRSDDFKIIEGVGPKIETILKDAGYQTWEDISKTDTETIKEILKKAGEHFAFHNPKTWPEQAQLAHQGRWEELEEFQSILNGIKQ